MVLTGGNHDTHLAEFEDDVRDMLIRSNAPPLINESIELGGFKIYGSPHSIAYGDQWNAFAGVDSELRRAWEKIPADTDILASHSPPFGILDSGLGSQSLLKAVLNLKPKVHIFGHIHHVAGGSGQNEIFFINACTANSRDDLKLLQI